MKEVKEFGKDQLLVKIFSSSEELSACAAKEAAEAIHFLLTQKKEVNILFSAAKSQSAFLAALKMDPTIPWNRINALQSDTYFEIHSLTPEKSSDFLKDHLFNHVIPHRFLMIDTMPSAEREAERYSRVLQQYPPDISFIGIEQTGEIALNTPTVADFQDCETVKPVELKATSLCQTGSCVIPKTALTVTIPVIMSAEYIFCMVPTENNAKAVYNTICQEITHQYPSTVLRLHPQATLYLDIFSAQLLKQNTTL